MSSIPALESPTYQFSHHGLPLRHGPANAFDPYLKPPLVSFCFQVGVAVEGHNAEGIRLRYVINSMHVEVAVTTILPSAWLGENDGLMKLQAAPATAQALGAWIDDNTKNTARAGNLNEAFGTTRYWVDPFSMEISEQPFDSQTDNATRNYFLSRHGFADNPAGGLRASKALPLLRKLLASGRNPLAIGRSLSTASVEAFFEAASKRADNYWRLALAIEGAENGVHVEEGSDVTNPIRAEAIRSAVESGALPESSVVHQIDIEATREEMEKHRASLERQVRRFMDLRVRATLPALLTIGSLHALQAWNSEETLFAYAEGKPPGTNRWLASDADAEKQAALATDLRLIASRSANLALQEATRRL